MLSLLTIAVLAQAPSLSEARQAARALYEGTSALPAVRALSARVRADFGAEVRVISESLRPRGAHTLYRRTAAFSGWARGVDVELLLDGRGAILRASATQASREAPTVHEAHVQQVRLRLPFRGTWGVLWGGRSYEDNRHAAVSDQRFALDLLRWAGRTTFTGQGTRNQDYACWGEPVLAPAAGTVVEAHDGVPDNVPRRARPGHLYGNHVVLDHGTGEYSLLAHLQRGTLRVRPGQRVHPGQVLGLTGNSGMSTEPHLHYQLMDGPDWRRAHGLPARFHGYVSGGALVAEGEPRRGEALTVPGLQARR